MRQRLRGAWRQRAHQSSALERSSIPTSTSAPTEYALAIVEVDPPIYAGEIWDISAMVAPENANSADDNVFFRTEVWIADEGGNEQSGDLPLLMRQSGAFNLSPTDRYAVYLRESLFVWSTPVFTKKFVKVFGAAAGSNVEGGDTISIREGNLMVKRLIPLRA